MDTLKIKMLFDTSINIINSINANKNEYLDPLSIIVILAINSYKPIGTKISIYDNKLFLSEKSILQGSIRSLYGDKKTDIKLLYLSILFACKLFLERNNKYLLKIFKKSIDGL